MVVLFVVMDVLFVVMVVLFVVMVVAFVVRNLVAVVVGSVIIVGCRNLRLKVCQNQVNYYCFCCSLFLLIHSF